jgi:hypothetical protein
MVSVHTDATSRYPDPESPTTDTNTGLPKMSPQERRVAATLVTQLIVFGIYAVAMLNYLEAGRLDAPDGFTFIGRSVFALIAASIVVTIVVQILLAIVTAIVTRGEDQDQTTDERARLIELKSMKISFIAFSTLFVATMGLLALNLAMPTIVLLLIIVAMFLSSVVGEAVKLVLYRRGS